MVEVSTFLWIVLGAVVVCWLLGKFNKLGRLHERVKETRKELKGRLGDQWLLIYGLINTVRGYAPDETRLYDRAENDVTLVQTIAAQTGVGNLDLTEAEIKEVISRLFAVGLSSPARDSVNFINLQTRFKNAWSAIKNAQRCHSAAVTSFNEALMVFPQSLVARLRRLEEEIPLLNDKMIEE